MSQLKAGNIQKGMYIIFKNVPQRVTKAEFMSPGKGSAINRVRFHNVQTGAVSDFTFKTNETVEGADVEKKDLQYLYQDGAEYVFMDPRSYEQISVPKSVLDGKEKYLIPEQTVSLLIYEDQPIGALFPKNVTLKVTEAQDAVAGNRVNAPKKPVILETGIEIHVPLFIKTGDLIIVDTETGEYLSRSN
jgi:elongation factor P